MNSIHISAHQKHYSPLASTARSRTCPHAERTIVLVALVAASLHTWRPIGWNLRAVLAVARTSPSLSRSLSSVPLAPSPTI